jgi:glucose-6-phosphate isomerase
MAHQSLVYHAPDGDFTLDLSSSTVTAEQLADLDGEIAAAHDQMKAIESGAIKNPDEGRQVTHFSDRIAYPKSDLFADVEAFFADLRAGTVTGSRGDRIEYVVINGIGGSALGPQLVQFALNGPYWNELSRARRGGSPRLYFTDNTDSAGVHDVLEVVELPATLLVTISKSGGTRETANNMLAFKAAFAESDLPFNRHAIAITMEGSKLDIISKSEDWLKIWPLAESIGGRTSETSVVGHVPAAAAGIDFARLLEGACKMDELTRADSVETNPAYLLAVSWYIIGDGRGEKNMVIVPYADRLVLLARYLQQLVMESLGKELDLDGNTVHQGLSVFGNKGGTDAHAFIQQLNDGRNDFFITFIEILRDAEQIVMDDGLTMGNYLHNFMQGLSGALESKKRSVVRLTFTELNATTMGMLIALYERAVAAYAELIHVNAFHQPGVEAYKSISSQVNDLTFALFSVVADGTLAQGSAAEFAAAAGAPDLVNEAAGILAKMAANGQTISGNRVTRRLVDNDWVFSLETLETEPAS